MPTEGKHEETVATSDNRRVNFMTFSIKENGSFVSQTTFPYVPNRFTTWKPSPLPNGQVRSCWCVDSNRQNPHTILAFLDEDQGTRFQVRLMLAKRRDDQVSHVIRQHVLIAHP